MAPSTARETLMSSTTVLVEGMTCQHCVGSVTTGLMKLSGVTQVRVDLHPGESSSVVIESEGELAQSDLESAIDEAGYQVVHPHSS